MKPPHRSLFCKAVVLGEKLSKQNFLLTMEYEGSEYYLHQCIGWVLAVKMWTCRTKEFSLFEHYSSLITTVIFSPTDPALYNVGLQERKWMILQFFFVFHHSRNVYLIDANTYLLGVILMSLDKILHTFVACMKIRYHKDICKMYL